MAVTMTMPIRDIWKVIDALRRTADRLEFAEKAQGVYDKKIFTVLDVDKDIVRAAIKATKGRT